MKKLFFPLLLSALSLTAFSQEDTLYTTQGKDESIKTLFGKGNAIGGYGAISMDYTQINKLDAFVFGARGGILLGHVITLGFGGSGFFNDIHYDSYFNDNISLAGGYGGFFFEPIIMYRYPVHISVPVMIGCGGIAVARVYNDNWNSDLYPEESDAFLVIEPGVELELNITRFFRFCIGGYYRYTSDINIVSIPAGVLRGFSGGVTFKFGKF